MVREVITEELLAQGFIKVGSKSHCEYWKKGDEVVTKSTRQDINFEAEYNHGYEDTLREIKPKIEDAFYAIEDGDIKYCKKLLNQVLEVLSE